jgi:GTPase SAR1 family protein
LDLAKKQSTRNVYRCHVIGAKNSGKTTLCQGLIGRTLEQTKQFENEKEELPKFVTNMVQVYGQEKYLVMQGTYITSKLLHRQINFNYNYFFCIHYRYRSTTCCRLSSN